MSFFESLIDEPIKKRTGKTYLFGKLGKSIKFNRKNWGAIGGDCDAPSLLLKLAENNPNDTFILISSNDFDKIKTKKPSNIISIFSKLGKLNSISDDFLVDALKDEVISGIIIMLGPTGSKNLDYYQNRLEFVRRYCAPIIHYLNVANIPWVGICNDPRYCLKNTRDLIKPPIKYLSQYNEVLNLKVFSKLPPDDNKDTRIMQINCEYSGIEKIILFNTESNQNFDDKNNDFIIVLNEGKNGVKSRYSELKKYVLDYFDDVSIYGEWYSEKAVSDSRFKGSKPFLEISEITKKSKYSFIIPISPGWTTSKYLELIDNGVIPLFHPDYDSQRNIDIDEFCRISSPEDLKNKIEKIKQDHNFYKQLISNLQKKHITEQDKSGKIIQDKILDVFKQSN